MDTFRDYQLLNADEPRGLAPAPVAEPDWDGLKAWLAIPLLYPIESWVEEAWRELPHLHSARKGKEKSDGNE